MPTENSFDYAVIRVVPHVERQEFFNAGVILFSPQQKFLRARVHLDSRKLAALAPQIAEEDVRARLDAIVKVCEGEAAGGPMAALSQRARFHWLVAPRSTVVQMSPVHSGLCGSAEDALNRLFEEQVLPPDV